MNEKTMFEYFKSHGLTDAGVCGLMGNLYAESALRSNNLQGAYERSLGMTDTEYTKSVDDGTYKNFITDSAGYGLAQWTYPSRKKGLLEYIRKYGVSISDAQKQCEYLLIELKWYTNVYKVLTTSNSVKEASDVFMTEFERPGDQSEAAKAKRATYSQGYYDKYVSKIEKKEEIDEMQVPTLRKGSEGDSVRSMQILLIGNGYSCGISGADGDFGTNTYNAVREYQANKGLEIDGICGPLTWGKLLGI